MSELHKFIFEGLPVRGMLVRLTDAWAEILQRRASNPYPMPVQNLLGEMLAAGVLLQANIKFDGALVFQVFGDGPLKVAVVEVKSDLSLRASATVRGEVSEVSSMSDLVNVHGMGRCAITLDPANRQPGQQPYQGVVSLVDGEQKKLDSMAQALQHYMRQSEQLESILVLAADSKVSAGLLIQRMPVQGGRNLKGLDPQEQDEHYRRIAILAASLKPQELLGLDVDTVLHRLFWQEKLERFEPLVGQSAPRFACSCSRQRVAAMIRGLGSHEAHEIIAERGTIEVGCEFCGAHYRFDSVDVEQLFTLAEDQPPSSDSVQ